MLPVRQLLDAGVNVGLGVDGSAAHDHADMISEARLALLVARGTAGRGPRQCLAV